MALVEICRGRWKVVVLAVLANGGCPAADFMSDLDPKDKAKLKALFQRFADSGPIRNGEKFKKLERDIFEFKSFQIRMLCYMGKSQVIVTHGLKKKRDDLRPADIERALRIKSECEALQAASIKTGKKK